ncbi:MAG: cobyrinate a,c-diamide synthase [Crocinitomicaceae bacterium]|nr:cobyrinate a,c-diamide synthase [Crocinitomicaceae bacterium]
MIKRFVIAAPKSNSGKTTVSLGILRLLKRKGLNVQPFKIGPDYIDPKFHELASEKRGVNLDGFMMSDEEIFKSLSDFSESNTIQCIEGVMGLFDGANKTNGSTAELAKKLKVPVLLVIDAKAIAYSIAPLIQGFVNFDSELQIMGVIFNRVGSERHYQILEEACSDIGVKTFGYLRTVDKAEIPSRHLGLNIEGIEQFDKAIDRIADEIALHVDWESILDASAESETEKRIATIQNKPEFVFAVAQDEAFNFIYPQLISAMKEMGKVLFFSPLRDDHLPDADFVYLPGGYPEMHLEQLSGNKPMLNQIMDFTSNGGYVFAECGGMMYLGKEMIDKEGNAFEMVGHFNFSTSIKDPKLHLGYRSITIEDHSFKGHEFHYSVIQNEQLETAIGEIQNARNKKVKTQLFLKQNVLASYIHFFIGNNQKLKTLMSLISNSN